LLEYGPPNHRRFNAEVGCIVNFDEGPRFRYMDERAAKAGFWNDKKGSRFEQTTISECTTIIWWFPSTMATCMQLAEAESLGPRISGLYKSFSFSPTQQIPPPSDLCCEVILNH
jgi:hypothetical protein